MSDQSKPVGASSSSSNKPDKGLSRRGFIEKSLCGAALAGATVAPAWAHGTAGYATGAYARARRPIPKEVAQYQYQPNGAQRCGVCAHFRPPGSCEIVAGPISPDGWCRYFRGARGSRGTSGPGRSY